MLDWRRDTTGVPAGIRDEILDEAIALVVMSREPIRNEQHLQGALWTSIRLLLAEHRAGRHDLRVGSRRRVDFDHITARMSGGDEPFDLVARRERIASAADFMAQLDPFERRVVALMATSGLGVKRAAKALGEPISTVLAAARSADRKLEQTATIAAAGRMCEYRQPAVEAQAEGVAHAQQERVARAHLAACAACRRSYAQLLHEMHSREFRRAASAAFLPAPIAIAHGPGLVERITTLVSSGRIPSGSSAAGERAAGLLGGGGLVKAAALSTALVVAGAGVGDRVIHSLDRSRPSHQHHIAPSAPEAIHASIRPDIAGAMESAALAVAPRPRVTGQATVERKTPSRPPPPSRDLGYLALGESAGGNSPPPRATTASAASSRASSAEEEAPPPPPASTGGGTSLSYLGQ